jgi:hypothetical protein
VSKTAIPPEKHELVLELAGQGKSTRQISEHLGTVGIKASYKAVGRLLQELRAQRAEVAKAVVREELSTTLTADVRRLERLVKKTLARIRKGVDADTFCKLAEQARKLIETKLKHSGAAEPDGEASRGPTIMIPPESDD